MFELKCRSCGKSFKPGFKLIIVNSDISCPNCKAEIKPEKDPKIKRASYFLTALALLIMFGISGFIFDMAVLFGVWAVIVVIYTIIKMLLICTLYNKGNDDGKV
ncbi:MAG: hypothetical protein LUD81_10640 [Clostridiales bacterium]|nr:hypothetical protein [Clostridiales bacterium]